MSTERAVVFGDELERAVAALPALPALDRLAALGFDVLSRQAEGKSLYAGKKFAAGRAQAHGVKRSDADTPLGNVVALIERGAEGATQQGLLAALFVRGFGDAVQARPNERALLLARFCEHCEWLELSIGQRVWPLLPVLLPSPLVNDVHAALGAATLQPDPAHLAGKSRDPRARARSAGRIALLAEADSPAARDALARIGREHGDELIRGLAGQALAAIRASTSGSVSVSSSVIVTGSPSTSTSSSFPPRDSAASPLASCSVSGRSGPRRRGPVLTVLSWLSGFALLAWLFRLGLFAIGYRREIELLLRGDALRVHRTTRLFGRTLIDEQRLHPLDDLSSAARTTRYPMLYAAVGTMCFALGVLLGGALGFDALRAGEPALLSWAALGVLLGSALDLAFTVLLPAGQGRVGLDLELGRTRSAQLTAVPLAEADRFLEALWQRLERPRRKDARGLA
ncbi:MAG TPA: hypothetical protein VK509_12540 [Polyangiales bacterium]|nr:hypothetical protein [Polyangiales bacterium]